MRGGTSRGWGEGGDLPYIYMPSGRATPPSDPPPPPRVPHANKVSDVEVSCCINFRNTSPLGRGPTSRSILHPISGMRLSFFLALPLLVLGTLIGTRRSLRDVVSLSEAQSKGYPHHKEVYSFLGPVHNVGFVNYSHAVNFASTTAFMHDFLSLLAPPGKTTCALLPPRPLPKVEGIRLASPTQPLPGEETDKGPPFSLTIEWQPSDAGSDGDAAARLSHRLETAKVMIFSTEASSFLDAASCKPFQTATKAFRVFSYTSGPNFWTLNLEPANELEPFASAKLHSVVEHDTERAMAVRGLSWADFPHFQRDLQISHTFTLNINSNNGLNAALSPIPLASFTGSSTSPGAPLNASYAVQVDCVNCFASLSLSANTELVLCQWQVLNVVIPRVCVSWWWFWSWRSACAGPWYVFSWSWPPDPSFGCDRQDTNEYNNPRYNPWNWGYHIGGHVKFKQSFDLSVTANVGIRVSGQAKVASSISGTIGGAVQQNALVFVFSTSTPSPPFYLPFLPSFLSLSLSSFSTGGNPTHFHFFLLLPL